MATAAPTELAACSIAIEPLNLVAARQDEGARLTDMPEIGQTHAVPLTVDEFTLVQRHYPIVFSIGDTPVPIALMGLNEGVNVFLDDDGRAERSEDLHPRLHPPLSVPARAASSRQRRIVAVLRPDVERGRRLRRRRAPVRRATAERSDQGDPRVLRAIRGGRPAHRAFIEDLNKSDLLMDGEVAIQPEGFDQPFVYRGFRMVDEEKVAGPARRRTAQDEPERHAAADLRAPLLTEPDARRVCAPDAAGQGAQPAPAAGDRRRSEPAYSAAVAYRWPSRASPSSTASASTKAATRSNFGPGFLAAHRGSSGGRSRSAARGHREPDTRDARSRALRRTDR